MEKYGFVYIWFDKKYKRYYVGSRWGNMEDGYICSSTWMRNSYNRRPQDFKRRILKIINTDRLDTYKEEQRYLDMIIQEELGVKYYNRTKAVHFCEKGKTGIFSEETLHKMSIAKKGISRRNGGTFKPGFTPWNKGIKGSQVAWNKGLEYTTVPCPDEKKAKISTALKGRKLSNGMTGHKHSEVTKQKISETKRMKVQELYG